MDPEECGRIEDDDRYEYEYYGWYDPKVMLLRRYDMLMTGTTHIMSFDDSDQPQEPYIVDGVNLNHAHYGHWYTHNANHGGSEQDLLGKSKWSDVRENLPQLVISNADIFKIDLDYMKNSAGIQGQNSNKNNIKRELADRVSPTWFACGSRRDTCRFPRCRCHGSHCVCRQCIGQFIQTLSPMSLHHSMGSTSSM